MSKETGVVVFNDGKKMWFKFNSTVNQCYPKLFDSIKEVADKWHEDEWVYCTCGGELESVIVYPYDVQPPSNETITFKMMACRKCKCLEDVHKYCD